LIDARWNPSCSHNSLTEGTLLNATAGFWAFLDARVIMSGIDGEVQREKFLSIHKAIAESEVSLWHLGGENVGEAGLTGNRWEISSVIWFWKDNAQGSA
jgi:hypothetical protein